MHRVRGAERVGGRGRREGVLEPDRRGEEEGLEFVGAVPGVGEEGGGGLEVAEGDGGGGGAGEEEEGVGEGWG